MSKTPLIDRLTSLKHDRYHMPGHKGKKPKDFPCAFEIDFTEIEETGNLYLADGVIHESEILSAEYFGANECVYLTGGSSQGILTAIYTLSPKKILCDRNSHKSLSNALMLFDLEYEFVFPSLNNKFIVPDVIKPQDIYDKLEKDDKIDTVFITSPNYYGICSDISEISKVCKKFGAKLIVDEAHGCHLPAVGVKNAIMQGADVSITSAHKTTYSLGQGAVLAFMDKELNFRENASIFGTSSPSYAIMASIEYAICHINDYEYILENVQELKKRIIKNTKFNVLMCDDICRLVINTKNTTISGYELLEKLQNHYNIVCEMADYHNIVLILTPADNNLEHLESSIAKISDELSFKESEEFEFPEFDVQRVMSIKEASLKKGEYCDISDCAGKVSKQSITPYPPGVPLVYAGEIISPKHVEYLTKMCYNNFTKICIIYN